MKLRNAGRGGLLVEVDSAAEVRALYTELLRRAPAGLRDIVPAARTVLLVGTGLESLASDIPNWPLADAALATGPLLEIPVVYDGQDMEDVVTLSSLSRAEIIRLHSGTEFSVAFCGFVPGFAYLTGLPKALHVSRRKTPRKRVDAGSVAMAGEFTGIYPSSSPGGWQLIGHTPLTVWDNTRQPPALLAPSTRVRFVEIKS